MCREHAGLIPPTRRGQTSRRNLSPLGCGGSSGRFVSNAPPLSVYPLWGDLTESG